MGRLNLLKNSSPIEAPIREHQLESQADRWIVTVFDNDYNTVEEVMSILIIATQCSTEEAEIETWEIHHLGKSVVHADTEPNCERVAQIIRKIGIQVVVESDC